MWLWNNFLLIHWCIWLDYILFMIWDFCFSILRVIIFVNLVLKSDERVEMACFSVCGTLSSLVCAQPRSSLIYLFIFVSIPLLFSFQIFMYLCKIFLFFLCMCFLTYKNQIVLFSLFNKAHLWYFRNIKTITFSYVWISFTY